MNFIICDAKTKDLPIEVNQPFVKIVLPFLGEKNKTFEIAEFVLSEMIKNGADKSSIIYNLGGGSISDLGGFVASIFMRGIEYVNVPTTFLAQIDAAIGGKTGINFGAKNIIGTFKKPSKIIFNTEFLKTLPHEEIVSGFGEVLKYVLLDSYQKWTDFCEDDFSDPSKWVYFCSNFKQKIVEIDPLEDNIRAVLNLGHTVGHAIEQSSIDLNSRISHGRAIAYGIYYESSLYDSEIQKVVKEQIVKKFGQPPTYQNIDKLIHLDKKKNSDTITIPILKDIGEYEIVKMDINKFISSVF